MISYFGDYPTSAVVYIPFNTFDSNDPTASVTVTNLVNTDVHIHKDGGTTQRNNAAGITMTVDYDSITGNHLLAIDTSDNTVADFFQAGHEYQVRIEGATVDGGTVNAWIGAFSLERSGGALALIKNGTYGLSALNALLAHADYGLAKLVRSTTPANTLSVDAAHLVAVPDTQKVDVETIKTRAVTCAAGVTVLASVGTASASTAQTGDSYAIVNGDHGLVSIQDDVDAIKTKTDLLPTWPANLEHLSITDTTGLVDITQTAADKAWGTAARVLTANTNLGGVEVDLTKIHGTAITETAGQLAAAFTKLFDVATPVLTCESVNQAQDNATTAEIVTALEANGTKLDHLWEMTEDDSGTRRYTINALENAPSGSGASAASIADAVWDEVLHTDHEVASSASVLLQGATAPSAADVANAVWDEAIADHTTATTFGGKNQKVVPSETINDYKATGFSTHSAADVWSVATRVLTANTNLSIPSAADVADAVWDEASTGHTDAGKAGTQLWTVLNDVPSTSEFEARTIAAADYTVVTDLGTVQTGDSYAIVNGDHGLVSIQDDVDSLVAATITNAAGADVAADIIALKAVADLTEDIVRNKLEITDADGAVVLRADNNTDALFTVAACVTDNLTTTIRKRLE